MGKYIRTAEGGHLLDASPCKGYNGTQPSGPKVSKLLLTGVRTMLTWHSVQVLGFWPFDLPRPQMSRAQAVQTMQSVN